MICIFSGVVLPPITFESAREPKHIFTFLNKHCNSELDALDWKPVRKGPCSSCISLPLCFDLLLPPTHHTSWELSTTNATTPNEHSGHTKCWPRDERTVQSFWQTQCFRQWHGTENAPWRFFGRGQVRKSRRESARKNGHPQSQSDGHGSRPVVASGPQHLCATRYQR